MRSFLLEILNRSAGRNDALFDCQDAERWPSGTIDRFVKAGLLKPAEPATAVRCDGCERECFERVEVKQRKGKPSLAVIHCREDPDIGRVEVDFARLRRWRVDWEKIREAVSSALESSGPILEPAPGKIWGLGRSRRIGTDHPILLYIGAEYDGAADLLRKKMGTNPGARPVVIHAGALTAELAEARLPCFFVPLFECLDVRDDQLFVDAELVASMVKSQNQALLESDEPYVFRSRGDFWDVKFEAGELKAVKNNVGMKYIAFLLSKPHEPFAAVEIDQCLSGNDEYPVLGGSGPSTDHATIRDLKSRIGELAKEMKEAEANGQPDLAEGCRDEKEKLEEYLLSQVGLGGKAKFNKNDAEKIRKRISKAINDAINNIRKHNPALADHLTRFIDTGKLISYQPNEKISWLI